MYLSVVVANLEVVFSNHISDEETEAQRKVEVIQK
jgi:hypothetical protein